MSFEIFEKEQRIIDTAVALLSADAFSSPAEAQAYNALLEEYKKLFKTTRRLIKISDRNEAELNKLAKTLDEKSTMLEGLSRKLAKYLSPQV